MDPVFCVAFIGPQMFKSKECSPGWLSGSCQVHHDCAYIHPWLLRTSQEGRRKSHRELHCNAKSSISTASWTKIQHRLDVKCVKAAAKLHCLRYLSNTSPPLPQDVTVMTRQAAFSQRVKIHLNKASGFIRSAHWRSVRTFSLSGHGAVAVVEIVTDQRGLQVNLAPQACVRQLALQLLGFDLFC